MTDPGVSLEFFCDASEALRRRHGEKYMGDDMNEFRRHLAEAERIYKRLEDCKPTHGVSGFRTKGENDGH